MALDNNIVIDIPAFARARADLGGGFVRILGYFREDGAKSVEAVEAAARAGDAAAMVVPAHTLKGGARQFGAERLSRLAQTIEMIARDCVESREVPTGAVEHVVGLRPLFDQTLAILDRETNPLAVRRSLGVAVS